ncbi:hypothetical protein B0H12DRAFT_1233620 [Mycena haematopus]|nr:hypothetical protein B0H12DRAFT_1233620 [Mycena haematopus]
MRGSERIISPLAQRLHPTGYFHTPGLHPFTSAVVLLVEAMDPPKHLSLPTQFILKLNDRRFGYRDYQRPELLWSPEIEVPLRRGIQKLVGPDRSHPIPTMYCHRYPSERRPDPDSPCPEWEGWELEIYIWMLKHDAYLGETEAYRHLHSLQGSLFLAYMEPSGSHI